MPSPNDSLNTPIITDDQIRAIANWIEQRQLDEYAVVIPDVAEVIHWLRAEAERAEGQSS